MTLLRLAGEDGERAEKARPRRRALLLVNRAARNGGHSLYSAIEVLRESGIDLEEVEAPRASDLSRLLEARRRDLDCIVLGGGDGTLNRAAPALLANDIPFGILPLGTANDLARTLGIGLDPLSAARVIASGHLRAIDLGSVNGHPFFNVASIGFSAVLAAELTAEAKRHWGVFGYALAGARLLARIRPFTAFIEHDDSTVKVKTVQIAVGNGRHYGGGLTVAATAELDDGIFHVYSLEISHWSRLLALVPALKRGTQGLERDVRTFQTRSLTIHTRRSRSVNTDGELTTATPARFHVLPKALRVFAPSHPIQ